MAKHHRVPHELCHSISQESLADGGKLAEYMSRKRIRYVIDVMPPAYWRREGLKAEVLMTEVFRHDTYPTYYVLQITPAAEGESVAWAE